MPIQNDFLAFAAGPGANVLTQAQYAALTSLIANGFSAGVAPSTQLNKVWRQSSVMTAVLAQFIVGNTGQAAVDDGTTATLLANLATAISVTARQNPVLADTGAANAYVVANLSAFTAYPTVSGLTLDVSIANANTGASTLNVDGLGAKPILGLGLQPLQGGELIAKGVACLLYVVASTVNSGNGAWIVTECAGGAQQVAAAAQSQHAAQLAQVLIASGMNCRLSYSGGNLVLNRYKGLFAYIPGSGIVTIPAGGITLAPSGLTASTLYYIYLTAAGTLIASTTGHVTDSSTGIEVMSGDNTKLLVGMEYATGATTWGGLCRSWYNDLGFAAAAPLTSNVTINGTVSNVEVSASLRTAFLSWPGEIVSVVADGVINPNVLGQTPGAGISIDGTAPQETMGGATQPYAANANIPLNCGLPVAGLTEGYHYATLLASVNGSFSATFQGGSTKGLRCSVKVSISPRK